MYRSSELAAFAIDEFRRGLQGITAEEALFRPEKADGTHMNAIAWTVQHIGAHWHNAARLAQGLEPENRNPPRDGTPPDYPDALAVFEQATADLSWLDHPDAEAMTTVHEQLRNETPGQFLARAILHTWFHIGEINAVRQLLAHPEVRYVGNLTERVHWRPEAE